MSQLIEIAFSGFWPFLGFTVILGLFTNGIAAMWSRLMRMLMVRKHGWPPNHLDADGDPINKVVIDEVEYNKKSKQ